MTDKTNPTETVAEAVREYVGDGDGADEQVLAAYEQQIRAQIAAEIEAERMSGPLVMLEWSPNDDSPPCVDFTCVCGYWKHLCHGPEWVSVDGNALESAPGVRCPECGVAWSLYRVRIAAMIREEAPRPETTNQPRNEETMTDRIDHRAAAERLLADAHEWGWQAGKTAPEVGERVSLAYSAAHALLAIHDALTAADRYATNEAKQREAAMTTRDEYHTMDELYEYRMLYNALAANAMPDRAVKSWRHSDGEQCFGGGWFVVYLDLPTGQVSNHYKAEHWGLFQVPEADLAPEWDGHTPAEAADRLRRALITDAVKAEREATGDDLSASGDEGGPVEGGGAPMPSTRRLTSCVERWPDCSSGEYNPACCRFPKSCSPTAHPLPDTPSGQAFTARDKGATDAVQAKQRALVDAVNYSANKEEVKRQLREVLGVARWSGWVRQDNPDPLEEDDHRDRIGISGGRWTRRAHLWCPESCECHEGSWKLDQIDARFGPLAFASEPPPDAAGDDLSASGDESGSVEGGA